jgi:hypothetical protein
VPGASASSPWSPPNDVGAGTSSPDRSPSQVMKSGHHDPWTVSADPSHSYGSGGVSAATLNVDLGLPGGLTSEAMWPLVDRMNLVSPPSSWVLR